jgi:hypothetical protein
MDLNSMRQLTKSTLYEKRVEHNLSANKASLKILEKVRLNYRVFSQFNQALQWLDYQCWTTEQHTKTWMFLHAINPCAQEAEPVNLKIPLAEAVEVRTKTWHPLSDITHLTGAVILVSANTSLCRSPELVQGLQMSKKHLWMANKVLHSNKLTKTFQCIGIPSASTTSFRIHLHSNRKRSKKPELTCRFQLLMNLCTAKLHSIQRWKLKVTILPCQAKNNPKIWWGHLTQATFVKVISR